MFSLPCQRPNRNLLLRSSFYKRLTKASTFSKSLSDLLPDGTQQNSALQNRRVCVLCNLKPATMRGIKSQAMVLAASSDDHSTVELVDPPESACVGEKVTFPGFTGDPDDVLNPKKIWETVQVDLKTGEDLVAYYKDAPFTTSGGVCKVSSICGGTIR